MSNLSELLPAGAGAKSAKFVASGTLASGVTVALKSNGQVEAVNAGTQAIGSTTDIDTGNTRFIKGCYDTTNNKVVVAYVDLGGSSYGRVRVGTVSGTSITFGSEATFRSAGVESISVCFDSGSSKVLIFYKDDGNSGYGTGIVGTVSGTSISFGTAVVFNSASTGAAATGAIASTYEPNSNKTAIFYRDNGDSSKGNSVVGVVSGTSISYGSEVNFTAGGATSNYISACTNTTDNTVNVVWVDPSNSSYFTIKIATISGTTFNYGGGIVVNSAAAVESACAYDSTNNKVVAGWADVSNSNYGKSKVGTSNGATGMSFGAAATFSSASSSEISGSFDSVQNKVTFAYTDSSDSSKGKASTGTVSGTSISFAAPVTLYSSGTVVTNNLVFDPDTASFVYSSRANPNFSGRSLVYKQGTASNSTSFAGITDQAIANTATGSVVVQGGVITNTGLIPASASVGSITNTTTSAAHNDSAFDSLNNKIVYVYANNNNYATAVVGTVSGSSISFGTPVIFSSTSTNTTRVTFDSNLNKAVVAYTFNASYHAKAIVGTVSGTTISFGTGVTFNAADTNSIGIGFDSNENKVVIAYKNRGNSDYGTSIVGTVSGTSISFGSATVYQSSNSEFNTVTFDSSNNKVVVAYTCNATNGTASVGTVSGTSISFGTAVAFNAPRQSNYISGAFDSNSNKVVLYYADSPTAAIGGMCVVATVSGTSISFGTAVAVGTSTSSQFTALSFDSSVNKIVMAYRGSVGGSQLGRLAIGTVSGTSITVADAITFNAGNSYYNSLTFDSNASKSALFYSSSAASGFGNGAVISFSADLTIGTDYFVQTDGTISTTSSSVPAGRALSTTSMLLEG